MNKIRGFKIKLRKREILKSLKYNSDFVSISPEIEKTIQDQIENAYEIIYPSIIYETYSGDSEKYSSVKEDVMMNSAKVKEVLSNSEIFTVMAATIGSKLEEKIDSIKNKDLTAATILDAVGSEAAEQCVNFISKIIRKEASKKECYLGMRFSPGYGDWPIEASGKILNLFEMDKIGLRVNESGIMLPRKSITAIQPWIPEK
ncbi:vitamin B12 dependent-methionine synthase activation domain-containing protein [Elusimicrobiota bacterium]